MSLQKVSSSASPEKLKALDLALSAIEKQFGKGAIMKLDNKTTVEKMAIIPTGCLSLDLALGIGGIPQGRIVEIYGPESSGKLLHYTADFIGSSGFDLWQRLCWDYAFDHIGIASPRIFSYLRQKMVILSEMATRLPAIAFMASVEVQRATVEIVLILQMCPKKAKVKWPTVPQDTHKNEEWLLRTAQSPERSVVRKVWNHSVDLPPLFYSTNEVIQAITDGALEKALFWTRWIIEEDMEVLKKWGIMVDRDED